MDDGCCEQVKVLGILGMVDEGEMDWKVVVINAHDPMAQQLTGTEQVTKV